MKDPLIVHVKDSQGDLRSPIHNFPLLQFPPPVRLLLLGYKLVQIAPMAKLHHNVELLSLSDALAVRYDVDMFEFFEEFDFVVDVLDLLFVLAGEFYLLDDVVLVLEEVGGQVGVAEGAESEVGYPCPIIFKILYSFIIYPPIQPFSPPYQNPQLHQFPFDCLNYNRTQFSLLPRAYRSFAFLRSSFQAFLISCGSCLKRRYKRKVGGESIKE